MAASLLVINPNSSKSVTDGLEEILVAPPGVELAFYTAPSHAPPSINDATTAALTTTACWEDISSRGLLEKHDGFLVCCFSDHPLVHVLRENTTRPVVGIMEAAVAHALFCGKRFGIISTGSGFKYDRHKDVYSFLGAASPRFAGLVTTGLGVVELREGDRAKVETGMKRGAAEMLAMGADVVILGCAGMAGMEPLVKQAAREVHGEDTPVKVIDGARAGIELLTGLVRSKY
ncbi:Asp/Glu/hydantoin racemase [Schizophyllum amplum]|uniref:Asp/Glu/hydantoin racemase n=1 Tax=Schizophyllum amplum TaxID=97359 RepID=A0A550CDZ2_9AGAR|nr:Asp/Glu/hydantoin racemase [Auriculariopsis ampla]